MQDRGEAAVGGGRKAAMNDAGGKAAAPNALSLRSLALICSHTCVAPHRQQLSTPPAAPCTGWAARTEPPLTHTGLPHADRLRCCCGAASAADMPPAAAGAAILERLPPPCGRRRPAAAAVGGLASAPASSARGSCSQRAARRD